MNIFSILIPKHTLTYLNANDPLDQAVAFLLGTTYTAIPVVDNQGRYVGIASEGDFLRAVMAHGRENLAKYKVADIVNKDEGAKVLNTVEKMRLWKGFWIGISSAWSMTGIVLSVLSHERASFCT